MLCSQFSWTLQVNELEPVDKMENNNISFTISLQKVREALFSILEELIYSNILVTKRINT